MERFTKVFFAAIFLLTISACDRKSCKNVVCPSYQGCYQGECVCFNGYEGTGCGTLSSTKFTGNWIVNENCGTNVSSPFQSGYSIYIGPSGSGASELSISNLFNSGNSAAAEIYNTTAGSEGTQIHVFAQNVGGINITDSYGNYTTANGVTEIIIVLNYTYNSFNYACQETFIKQ